MARDEWGDEGEPLDAYSRVVISVSERLVPSIAHLRSGRGSGSGVVISADGFIVTSASASRLLRPRWTGTSGSRLHDADRQHRSA